MRFPRNAKPFRGQLDAAPFAGVFFCLLIFLLLCALGYTPGIRVDLPEAPGLPGAAPATLAVALDSSGRLYFENQLISPDELKVQLESAARKSKEPLTLVVQADKRGNLDAFMQLALMARSVGIKETLLATLPRATDAPARGGSLQP